MWIDTHAHLADSEFNEDRNEVIQRAKTAGLEKIVLIGCDVEGAQRALKLAYTDDMFDVAIGFHSEGVLEDRDEASMFELMKDPKVKLIGEIGLDYFYNHSPKDVQIQCLEEQLQIALDNNLPVSFHVREAFDDFWPIFDNFTGISGVLHSFTDSRINAEAGLSRGLYIGINGISTFTRDEAQIELFTNLPLSKIILETDAPYLTPRPFRGKMNEVGYVELVGQWVAQSRGLSFDDVAAVTTSSARSLFSI